MGHIRLGSLPRTYRWKEVISLLESSGSLEDIADKSVLAAQNGLKKVAKDTGFVESLANIFKFVEALNSKDYETVLQESGFPAKRDSSLIDLLGRLRSKNDSDLARSNAKSDPSEIAINTFTEILSYYSSQKAKSFFETTADDTHQAAQTYLKGKNFKAFMHEFFSRFTRRYLSYYLSRELPSHVGSGKLFSNIEDHSNFNKAFDLYIRQAVRITDEFTPGWFGKAKYEGRLDSSSVSKYAFVAFKKIISEFR